MTKRKTRLPLGELERKILNSIGHVTFLPGDGDKKFYRSIKDEKWLTENQRNYLFAIFDKYRRQIPNYELLSMELEPERFKVTITPNLFDVDIVVKDTFTAKDRWTKKDRTRNTLV